jgi:lysyl-tRNA synthetase class 2
MHHLEIRSFFFQHIRNFFNSQNFLEVLTPIAVANPGMETHIHPFKLHSVHENINKELYLHSSPEFKLKEFLSYYPEIKQENIYSMNYCFRDEPNSPIHRAQFLMLEWYRVGVNYELIKSDIEKLITSLLAQTNIPVKSFDNLKFTKKTIQEIFVEFLNIDILNFLELKSIQKLTQDLAIKIPDVECAWDDYFWLIFLNLIEPKLKQYDFLILEEFPYHLSALSNISTRDSRVCKRFEFYIKGVEIANCYEELLDLNTHKERFNKQAQEKKENYHYSLPEPNFFYQALARGIPESSGIALGVERLMGSLIEIENIFWD